MKNANDLLQEFNCTEKYYKHILSKLLYTDGIHEACTQFQCFWFLDVVFSYQTPEFNRMNNFQVWRLKRINKSNTFYVVCTDGNKNKIVQQEIPFSDFPHDSLTFFYSDSVCLLPTEY